MNTLDEKEKNRKIFEKKGCGRRQDHGTRGNSDERKDSDVSEWLQRSNERRDFRHGRDDVFEILG